MEYFVPHPNKSRRSQFCAAEVVTMKNEMDIERKVVTGDGIDRRRFLECMAWAGTGLIWTFVAGVPTRRAPG